MGLAGQFLRLCPHGGIRVGCVAGGEARQDRVAVLRIVGAAPGDLDRVVDRFGNIGEKSRHLGLALQEIVGREAAAVVGSDDRALGDGDQRVMRLVVVSRREKCLVGGDQRQVVAVGELDGRRLDQAVIAGRTRQLDIEPVAEKPAELAEPGLGNRGVIGFQRRADRPALAAGQADNAFRLPVQRVDGQMHAVSRGDVQIHVADQPDEIAVAGLVRRKHHHRKQIERLAVIAALAFVGLGGEGKVDLAADDRLHAILHRLLGKFQRAKQIVGVGDGDGRSFVLHRMVDDLAEWQCALEQRIGRMHTQMDEGSCHRHQLRGQRHRLAFQRVAWKSLIRHGVRAARKDST